MVSVIIPNYNHAPYLKQRIESVLNQTYKDFELIILDDKSPDNSRDIIEQYRDNPFVSNIVYNETNSGSTFKQWQKGLSLAKGEYIWIAESDDYADPTFLEKIICSINEYNSIVCFSKSHIVDKNNKVILEKDTVIKEDYTDTLSFLSNHLLLGCSIYNASMVVFKKAAIKNVNWNDIMGLRLCGDWLFWLNIMSQNEGNVSEVKEYLNFFRTHTANVSNMAETDGLTFLEGFVVSNSYSKVLCKADRRKYNLEWFNSWIVYRRRYHFSKKTDIKILFMFLRKRPVVVFYEIKRQLGKLFRK